MPDLSGIELYARACTLRSHHMPGVSAAAADEQVSLLQARHPDESEAIHSRELGRGKYGIVDTEYGNDDTEYDI